MYRHIRNRASAVLFDFLKATLSSRKKSEVRYIVPVNICPVVVWTLFRANVEPVFVDLDKDTFCIDEPQSLELLSQEKDIVGIIFNHTYGTNYDPTEFFKKLRNNFSHIKIVDDKCLCKPKLDEFNPIVDLTLYSIGYGKFIDLGGGGFGILKNQIQECLNPYNQLDLVKVENLSKGSVSLTKIKPFLCSYDWLNLEELNTSMVIVDDQTIREKVEEMTMHKQMINDIYLSSFPKENILFKVGFDWRFNLLIESRDEVLNEIFKNGLFASKHYKRIRYKESIYNSYPVAEFVENKVLNLFNDCHFSAVQAEQITKIIKRYL